MSLPHGLQSLVSKIALRWSYKNKYNITNYSYLYKSEISCTIRASRVECDLVIAIMEATTEETIIELGNKEIISIN